MTTRLCSTSIAPNLSSTKGTESDLQNDIEMDYEFLLANASILANIILELSSIHSSSKGNTNFGRTFLDNNYLCHHDRQPEGSPTICIVTTEAIYSNIRTDKLWRVTGVPHWNQGRDVDWVATESQSSVTNCTFWN